MSVRRQPVADPGIEVGNALPVKRMAGARIQVQLRAANAGRDFLGHPARCEDVRLTANHQRRAFDAAQLRQDVVRRAGSRLRLQRMQRLRLRVLGRLTPAGNQFGQRLGVVPGGL